MSEAKLVKHIPSGKRLPYWDKYIYECIDCGEEFSRSVHTSRINPYCCNCKRKHDKERAKELKEFKQKEHDKEIYNKAIDEFLEILLKRNTQNINNICKAQFCEGDCIKCEKEYMKAAIQLKEGVSNK